MTGGSFASLSRLKNGDKKPSVTVTTSARHAAIALQRFHIGVGRRTGRETTVADASFSAAGASVFSSGAAAFCAAAFFRMLAYIRSCAPLSGSILSKAVFTSFSFMRPHLPM